MNEAGAVGDGPTSELTYDLEKVRPEGVDAILDGLRLDSANVASVALVADAKTLQVRLANPSAAAHVSAFVSKMTKTHRMITAKIIAEHRVDGVTISDIDAGLAGSPYLHELGDGLTGLSGPLLGAFRFFEDYFRELAREFEAEEHHYPVLVPSDLLAEVGYFENFPQHVTMCSHLPDDLPLLSALAEQISTDGSGAQAIAAELAEAAHVLTPGVCIPCYRLQRDRVLDPDQVVTLTMSNHVFRYEGSGFRPLTRAWDFTVRDIVFFGSFEALRARRLAVMERCLDLCRSLDLEVTVELANDPFFVDTSRDKAIYQRLGEVKYELLFSLPHRGRQLAASSFNLHRDFYTGTYNTRFDDGQLCESACMGFGMDRWLYGFLSQKGLDPAGWPEPVRAFCAR